ncbi:2OG-Fe(II) oxygenase superfamily [Rhizoctonia solani]|uniref:2OG-Fe(II) oxygenase superfamily n=1 Tax=Rhizoctonia solani TaxID=456999 RepID=A0A8H7IK00_9AGAM|nr:2OG-Fe(II) oxygenase superfamily [Rhizoctonia solani]
MDTSSRSYKKALRHHLKSQQNKAHEDKPPLSPFRAAEKKYKSRFPPPDLSQVLDLGAARKRTPGLVLLPFFVAPTAQRSLVTRCLREHARSPNESNLDAHYQVPRSGLWNAWERVVGQREKLADPSFDIEVETKWKDDLPLDAYHPPDTTRTLVENEPGSLGDSQAKLAPMPSSTLPPSTVSQLVPKLRWSNIGLNYHWGTKSYDFERDRVPFPDDIRGVCVDAVQRVDWTGVWEGVADGMEWKDGVDWDIWERTYEPDAGIINFYQPRDTLMGHVDRSEISSTTPLVSISLGNAAIFLIGGLSRDIEPIPILLRSGDVVIMSGPGCRRAYHGVPRILENSTPAYLTELENQDRGDQLISEYIKNARINCNVRQISMNGFARRLGLGGKDKDKEPLSPIVPTQPEPGPQQPVPPQQQPLPPQQQQQQQQQSPIVPPINPAVIDGKALTNGIRSPTTPTGVDDSTIRQRPPRSSSKSSAVVSPPPRPVVNTKAKAKTKSTQQSKDDLLMSLLASEAVMDSRTSEILSAEQVEELKKEDALLQSRFASSTKKLALETKMRDAARSLTTLNATNKSASKQTQEQLEEAIQRLEAAQADHMQIQTRHAEVQRKLLEHRAGVLSAALRKTDESLSVPPSSTMSPTDSSRTSLSKFDGAHFFAGHAESTGGPPMPMRAGPSPQDILRMKQAEETAKAATKRATELSRDLGLLKLEKAEAETRAALDIQQAEEQVAELRSQIGKLTSKSQAWEKEREELLEDVAQRDKEIEELQDKLNAAERQGGKAGGASATEVEAELEGARKAIRGIVRTHRINMQQFASAEGESGVFSVANMVAAIGSHIEFLDETRKGLEKAKREAESESQDAKQAKEKMLAQLDESRQDTQESLRQIATLERQMMVSPFQINTLSDVDFLDGTRNKQIVLWNFLDRKVPKDGPPSSRTRSRTETRLHHTYWAHRAHFGQPTHPPYLGRGHQEPAPALRPQRALLISPPPGKFSIDAFNAKVRALVADDRAIIERLIKFATTHELLKTNAEKAQKLAQESTISLKTYQDQVQTLEERNNTMASRQTALIEELEQIQAGYEELLEIKAQLEIDAARQAEVCANLTEANNTLSASALSLANESSTSVVAARAKLETEAAALKKKSDELEAELDRVRGAEQSQRIALLDELNAMQTENTNLRNQIRALQSK